MATTMIPLADLVEDLSIYPRNSVDSGNVAKLVNKLELGIKLHPIVADRESKRIIDGFHRRRAYLRVLGPDASVKVELRSYNSDTEMLTAGAAANADHGLQLEMVEQRRVALRLHELGVDDDTIAVALRVPPVKVNKLRCDSTVVIRGGGTVRIEPLKRSLFHFRGRPMTEAQAQAQQRAPGTSYMLLVTQLRDALQEHLLDETDVKLTAELQALRTDLGAYLGKARHG